MISDSKSTCPKCGGQLKYYDTVKRIVRTKYGVKNKVDIRRFRCQKCSAMHRELPDFIFPYKQYEAEIIIGVLEGFITCETLGFEDYPCEMTMIRWRLSPPKLFSLKAVSNLEQQLKGGKSQWMKLYLHLVKYQQPQQRGFMEKTLHGFEPALYLDGCPSVKQPGTENLSPIWKR